MDKIFIERYVGLQLLNLAMMKPIMLV